MTMRSMPPASSHFAESPVPAPPPMIGSPRATMAWNFSISFLRAILGMSAPRFFDHVEEVLGQRLGEGRIVDVVGQADQPPAWPRPHRGLQRLEQRRIGRGIPEGAAGLVEQRDP